jgi:acyl-CoA synthetase (AMP-forming)/AMP-acid ligase II
MSFASPFPDVEIPSVSVYDYLFGNLDAADGARVALVDAKQGTETSYRDAVGKIDAFAGALAHRGIAVGDVVGLLAPNSTAFAVAFHGILRAGATATTINVLFTAKDIVKQLMDSKATMLITVSALLPAAKEAAAAVGISDDRLLVLDGSDGHPSAEDLLGAGLEAPKVSFDPATHLAVLPYSSGTTGNPKGVKLTHRNLVANIAQTRPVQDVGADDVVIAIMPFFHIYGMTVLLNAVLHARARLVMMGSFDLEEFLATIANHKVTVAYIAPPVAVALAKHPLVDSYDVSTLRAVLSGAAPLDEELGHAVADRIEIQPLTVGAEHAELLHPRLVVARQPSRDLLDHAEPEVLEHRQRLAQLHLRPVFVERDPGVRSERLERDQEWALLGQLLEQRDVQRPDLRRRVPLVVLGQMRSPDRAQQATARAAEALGQRVRECVVPGAGELHHVALEVRIL